MTWKAYTPKKLSNDEYQLLPAVSGSGLATIYKQSPAHYRFQEKEETKALAFGIAAHSMLLESESFAAEFVRGVDAGQYKDLLVNNNDLSAWLKSRGQKISGDKWDKIQRVLMLNPDVFILDVLEAVQYSEATFHGQTVMEPEKFDDVTEMRNAIMQDETMAEMLKGGFAEYSLVGELGGVQVKTRPDLITSAGGIIQYKTTLDCQPLEFGRKIDGYGYLLKAAMEWECFTACYGTEPKYYIWLAQEKKKPYVWKPYSLTSEALAIGRIQLQTALDIYARCKEDDRWPAYGSDIEPIQIPEWMKRQYNVGDE